MTSKLIAAFAAVIAFAGSAFAQVSVDGTGTVTAKPDMAYVTLSVVTDGKVAADATKDNTAKVTALCKVVEDAGIPVDDIKVAGFSVSQRYSYPKDSEPVLVGYTVRNSLSVTVRDLKVLGSLLDKAVVGGTDRIGGVRYDVKDKKSLFDKARQNAFADAKAKAELYATTGGFKLGGLKSLSEGRVDDDDGTRSEGMYATRGASADRAPVPTAPVELKFQVHVNASWEIK